MLSEPSQRKTNMYDIYLYVESKKSKLIKTGSKWWLLGVENGGIGEMLFIVHKLAISR